MKFKSRIKLIAIFLILITLGLGGYIFFGKSVQTANPDATGANWKTYTNTAYKYTIQYPSDVTVNENTPKNNVELKKIEASDHSDISRGYVVSITYISVTGSDNYIKQTYENSKTTCNSNSVISSLTDTIFAGINAKQYSVKNCLSQGNSTQYFLIKGNFLVSISRNEIGDLASQNSNTKITNQILSTFKFLDQNQKPDAPADTFIQNYYNEYFDCLHKHFTVMNGHGLLQDCPYDANIFTPTLYSGLQNGTINRGGNPILCAQDMPMAITFDKAITSVNGTATVVVHTFWGSSAPQKINVGLQEIDNQWKVASINCVR